METLRLVCRFPFNLFRPVWLTDVQISIVDSIGCRRLCTFLLAALGTYILNEGHWEMGLIGIDPCTSLRRPGRHLQAGYDPKK
jgi:hypothetical protein